MVALYPTVDVAAVESVTTLHAGQAARQFVGGTPQQFPERYRQVASSTWITPDAPPTLVIQGTMDSFVPPASVQHFVQDAEARGVPIRLLRVWLANHAFDDQAARSPGFQLVTTVAQHFMLEHQ